MGQVKTWAKSLPLFLVIFPQEGSLVNGLPLVPWMLSLYVDIQEARPFRMVWVPVVTEPSPLGPMLSRWLPSRDTTVTSSRTMSVTDL